MNLDLDDLTLEEVEVLEEVSGVALDGITAVLTPKAGEAPKPKARLLTALAYIAARREDPSVTLADVKAMKVSALFGEDGITLGAADRPTEASAP